jgi:hypothetical protein
VVELLESQGDIGKRAIDVLQQTNEALLKAAAQTPKTSINNVEITRQEAEVLRVPARKKAEVRHVVQSVQVVNINTSDPYDLQIVIMDPRTKDQYKFRFKDDLFSGPSRERLFESLKNRTAIWVELALREIDGEIRSVQLLRTVDPPPLTAGELAEN